MGRNRIYVLWNKQPSKYTYVAQIQSMGVKGTRSMYVRVLSGSKSKGCIRCTLPFIKSDIPIVLVFRALEISTGREIVQFICHDLNDTEMMNFLWPSLEEAEEFEDQQAALDYIGRKGATDHENEENMRRHARDIFQKNMLPHVSVDDNCETKKAYYLGYFIHRLLLCALGRRREDDRDHLSNTRLNLVGLLFAELFRKVYF